MSENNGGEQSGEKDDKKIRSEPPPKEPVADKAAPSSGSECAKSWPERIGYGF